MISRQCPHTCICFVVPDVARETDTASLLAMEGMLETAYLFPTMLMHHHFSALLGLVISLCEALLRR